MRYDELVKLLPKIMQEEGNSINIKNILKIYDEATADVVEEITDYGNMLDIATRTGDGLDYIGILYAVPRIGSESDDVYRDRIIETVIRRKTPVTLFDIQEAIDAITEVGTLHIKNNFNGRVANVYLTGSAPEKYITLSVNLVKTMIGAGISILVPVSSLPTWEDVFDQFNTWGSLSESEYIW